MENFVPDASYPWQGRTHSFLFLQFIIWSFVSLTILSVVLVLYGGKSEFLDPAARIF